MSGNNSPENWAEFTQRFIRAFFVAGIIAAIPVLVVWNTFLPASNFYLPLTIWFGITASVSVWTAKTDCWDWATIIFWWIDWR